MRKNFTIQAKGYLEGLAEGDKKTIQLIHENYYERILHFILSNNGNDEDAKDVFQDALMVIYVKVKNDEITRLDCTFYTFLYSISRNIWLKKIRKSKMETHLTYEDEQIQNEVMEAIEVKERWALYREKFRRLNADCQEILKLYFDKVNFNDISSSLGMSSGNYAKKKKCLCKKKLMDMIMNDERYKEVKYEQ